MDANDSFSAVRRIPIADIVIDENHPGRDRFTDKDLQRLAESIDDVGLINPITVSSSWGLIAGLNRLRACRDILGWTSIDARVRKGAAEDDYELHPAVAMQLQYGENVARKAMSATEAAELARTIKEVKGLTKAEAQERVAEISGISARSQQRVEAIERATQDEDPDVAAAATEALANIADGGSVGGAEAKVKAARSEHLPERDEDWEPPADADFDGGVQADDGPWDTVLPDVPVEEPADPGAGIVDEHGLRIEVVDDGRVEAYQDEMARDVRTALVGLIKISEQSDSIVMLEPGDLQEGLDRLTGPMYGKLRDLLATLNDAMDRRHGRDAA